jgi:hypothetical protein
MATLAALAAGGTSLAGARPTSRVVAARSCHPPSRVRNNNIPLGPIYVRRVDCATARHAVRRGTLRFHGTVRNGYATFTTPRWACHVKRNDNTAHCVRGERRFRFSWYE